jgi:hypothetical protein
VSIPVDVADLPSTLEGFGTGYLLTTADGRVKVVAVDPESVDGLLLVRGPGRGSTANIAANPAVTLVFPPTEPPGFTLLVDGTAEVVDGVARVTPTSAVLHRPVGAGE